MSTAFLIYLGLVLSTLLPMYLESRNFREYITQELSQTLPYQINFAELNIAFLPKPHLSLTEVTLDKDLQFRAFCPSIRICPDITDLLSGQSHLGEILCISPSLSIQAENSGVLPSLDLAHILQELTTTNIPLKKITVKDGRCFISYQQDIIVMSDIQACLEHNPSLFLRVSCRSSLWDNLTLLLSQKKMNPSHLEGQLDLRKGDVDKLQTVFSDHGTSLFTASPLNLHVDFQGRGNNDFGIHFQGDLPHCQVLYHTPSAQAKGIEFHGELLWRPDYRKLSIETLQVEEPHLDLTARWQWRPPFTDHKLVIKAKDLKVALLHRPYLHLKNRSKVFDTVLKVLQSGTFTSCVGRTQGASLQDLARQFYFSGHLQKGKVLVPKIDLPLDGVNSEIIVDQGILEAKNISGRSDRIHICSGKVQLGLNPTLTPFVFATHFQSALEPLPGILNTVLAHNPVIKELNKFNTFNGKMGGTFAVSRKKARWQVSLQVQDLQATVQHPIFAHPITLDKGQLSLAKSRFSFHSLELASADAHFEQVTGFVDWEKKVKLSLQTGAGSINLKHVPQVFWQPFEKNKFLSTCIPERGHLLLEKVSWQGLVTVPKSWEIALLGSISNITIPCALTPKSVFLKSGQFQATRTYFSFNDWHVEWNESRFALNGAIDMTGNKMAQGCLNLTGEIDPRTLHTVLEKIGKTSFFIIPQEPIHLSEVHFQWDNTIRSCRCHMLVSGTSLQINMHANSRGWSLTPCSLKDQFSQARFAISKSQNRFTGHFKGILNHQTLNKLFAGTDFFSGIIQGDFSLALLYPSLILIGGHGSVQGTHLALPNPQRSPVHIKSVSLQASPDLLRIESSEILLRDTPFWVNGTVTLLPKANQIDLFLAAETINWQTFQPLLDKFSFQNSHGSDLVQSFVNQFQGIIQISLRSFQYNNYLALQPLETRCVFKKDSPFEVILLDSSRLCTIPCSGGIKWAKRKIRSSFQLSANDKDLKETMSCIQQKNHPLLTGSFDFSCQIQGEGSGIQAMKKSLHGPFHFEARDGRIFRFDLLAKILRLLNSTEIFFGQMPEMDKKGFGYKDISVQGEVTNEILSLKKGVIDGHSMEIGFQGDIDLQTQDLDLILLVSPLKTIDRFFEKIPVLSKVMGGHLVSVPVRISGQLRDPKVVPLSPKAVSSELYEIMKRSLKVPFHMIQPFMTQPGQRPKETTQ
jgi:hypothetical protein